MSKISKVVFYDEPAVPEICLDSAAKFTQETFNVSAEKRGPILALCDERAIHEIAASRMQKLHRPFQRHAPTPEEIEFERRNALDTGATQNITYYDGFELQNALGRLVPEEELGEDILHIIFTNKLTCTYDDTDSRYHGRAVIMSNPSIISTTGIIEAPAKPRQYYIELIKYSRLGVNLDSLKEKFRGTFLEYRDARLGRIVQGYILQAVFYHETLEAFCDSADCRLYNAHWQKDLLHSQLEVGSLCERHQSVLDDMVL